MTRTTRRRSFATLGLALLATTVLAQQASLEDQARRQLESGRSFARQGNFAEALRDFKAVAETYAGTSVADNALLEMALYYLDVARDTKEAATAADTILKRYPTSDSAPEAYVITGRLAMAKSHQSADLETALANFDRVSLLFPGSDTVPKALALAGEALWYQGRLDDALASLVRAEVEYPNDLATAQAHLNAAQVMVSRGEPVAAMEELQQVRNRWPQSPEAATALGRLTILHRLFVRARAGAAYAPTAETPGPPKLQNVVSLGVTAKGAIYWAADSGFGLLTTQKAPAAPTGLKPRGFGHDNAGNLVVIETAGVRPFTGNVLPLFFPHNGQMPTPLAKIDAAAQLNGSDWLVVDDDEKGIQRISKTGEYLSQFSPTRVTRLAVNARDEVAGLDRDQKGVVFFDGTGKVLGRIPAKGTGYDFQNLEDLAFDAFGYLYVLDRGAVAVFSPFGPGPAKAGDYKLVALFAEPATNPNAFRRATAFALDLSGGLYLYDERAERVRVYR